MNIVVVGQVGSGKTTQAKNLADNLGLPLLNVGDLLYYASQGEGEHASRIKKIMESGGIVDDDTTLKLVEEHLKGSEHETGIVIDGFPRTLAQAQRFSLPIDKVFNIKISDQTSIQRLLARGRKDDTAGVIEKRLKVYHQETEPIIAFYKELGLLQEVDGEKGIEEIAKDVAGRLEG